MSRIDPEQLEKLMESHGAALVLYARQWCNSPDDAVQEALIELIHCREVPEYTVAWLFKVTRYRAINIARSEKRRKDHHHRAAELTEPWFVPKEENHKLSELSGLIENLPPDEREVVVAKVWGGLTFEQIAELNGSSSSSTHRLYHKALKTLARAILNT